MNDSGSWAQGSRLHEQLTVVDDMNYFESCAQGSRYYEQLKDVDDMNESRLWA